MMANTKKPNVSCETLGFRYLVLCIVNLCAKKMNKTFGSISLVLLVKQT